MDAVYLDSTRQQVVVHGKSSYPALMDDPKYKELLVIHLDMSERGYTTARLCKNPAQTNAEARALIDTGYQNVTGPELRILGFYDWLYHTSGKFFNWNQWIIGFRSYLDEVRLHAYTYTTNNIYSLNARINRSRPNDSYLGGFMTSRQHRPGETWTRGNDLADGPFEFATFQEFLMDMLSAEMIDVNQRKLSWGLSSEEQSEKSAIGKPYRSMMRYDHTYDAPTRGYRFNG